MIGRVAAPDSLKNETFCRDLKNVRKHAAKLTQAPLTTPVLSQTATEHWVTSTKLPPNVNTTPYTSLRACSSARLPHATRLCALALCSRAALRTARSQHAHPCTVTAKDLNSQRRPEEESWPAHSMACVHTTRAVSEHATVPRGGFDAKRGYISERPELARPIEYMVVERPPRPPPSVLDGGG